jgi:Holliday junction resolvase-like predicted endonuclease
MDLYEEAVMYCLVANGETFVAPQFEIGKGWSCPDFVAIRPSKRKVYVVEVTAAGGVGGLVEKVHARQSQWISRLRKHLEEIGVVGSDWSYSVLVFVRRDQYGWFKGRIADAAGVTVFCLEDAIAHWEWNPSVWTSNFSFETDALKRAAQ